MLRASASAGLANVLGIDVTCRACGEVFFVCRACWRGQAYCSSLCRERGRRASVRAAGRRYQQSEEGRVHHRERQDRYRGAQTQSVSARVTHQGTAARRAPVDGAASNGSLRPALLGCRLCGCVIDLLPSSREVRSLRRLERRRRRRR